MKTEDDMVGLTEAFGRYPSLKFMGSFVGILGMLTGIFFTTFTPKEGNLDDWMLMFSPLLVYLGASAVFETVQWLFLSMGKRLRRAVWYGAYLFGVIVAPLFWMLS